MIKLTDEALVRVYRASGSPTQVVDRVLDNIKVTDIVGLYEALQEAKR